jgi:peptide/nickel transport system permease protein
MYQYILRRMIQMVFVIILFSVIVFTVLRLIPGDPATAQLGLEAGDQAYKELRSELGLDQPIFIQYLSWASKVLQGDFGISWSSQKSAVSLIKKRLPASIWLTLSAMTIALIISIPAGIISGIKPNSWIAHIATFFSLTGIALPSFWLGLMLILTFTVFNRWLPPSGYISPFIDPIMGFKHLILPSLTLGIEIAAPLTRFIRSGMLDVMNSEYIRTARAKGLTEFLVISRHALRNAMLSVVTILGVFIGYLLGGSIITESVFNYPGVGTLLLQAIQQRDYGVIQGIILFISLIFMFINLMVDISYAILDPRIRYE